MSYIVVTTRSPFSHEKVGSKETIKQSTGGVSTSLRLLMEKEGGTWICWGDGNNDRNYLEERLENFRIVRVLVSGNDRKGFYEGYSNSTLWPLFHYFRERIVYNSSTFESYQRVNRQFLDSIIRAYSPGDTIWVHDYQLSLLPGMIREAIPESTVVFTWHIPWVSGEFFSSLPESEQIVRSISSADIITFHTSLYMRNFLDSVEQLTGESDTVRPKVHSVPLGIDYSYYHKKSEDVHKSPFESQQMVLFSIDRMDYTKGLLSRVNAIEYLLQEHPDLAGKFVYYLVVSPSRTQVWEYRVYRRELEMRIGRLNGRFSTVSWVPIVYMNKRISDQSLMAFYRFSQVALITPLFDGLNLVAKEFVASSRDGVLIISKFAGSSEYLDGAVKVNPNSREDLAEAIYSAFRMSPEERRTRLEKMKREVSRHNSSWWVRRIRELSRKEVVRVAE